MAPTAVPTTFVIALTVVLVPLTLYLTKPLLVFPSSASTPSAPRATVSASDRPPTDLELYDLADVLGLSTITLTDGTEHVSTSLHTGRPPSSSVGSSYLLRNPDCPSSPSLSTVRALLDAHAQSTPSLQSSRLLVSSATTITLPLSCLTPLSLSYLSEISHRVAPFSSAVLLPDCPYGPQAERLFTLLTTTFPLLTVTTLNLSTDDAASLLPYASNVHAHADGWGVLSLLLPLSSNVSHSPGLSPYLRDDRLRWLFGNGTGGLSAISDTVSKPVSAALHAMMPVSDSCCSLRPYGDNSDGTKIICDNARGIATASPNDTSQEPCWVLSLGCGGKWSFERAIMQKTRCHIHTFDCTKDFRVPPDLSERTTIHKICIGTRGDPKPWIVTWRELIRIGSKGSGMATDDVMPIIAKVDVEGHEVGLFREWMEDTVGDDSLIPDQIAMEVHIGAKGFDKSPEHVHSWFDVLWKRGYELVHRADNPFCASCSEVTLVRRPALP